MSNRVIISFLTAIEIVLMDGCVDPYNPAATHADLGYLVISGNFAGASDTTNFVISRTANIDTGEGIVAEGGAQVQIIAKNGTSYALNESVTGTYTLLPLNIDEHQLYQLSIKTAGGKQYASDFVAFKVTPPIDSVSWTADNSTFTVQINTHDDNDSSRYYLWHFQETYAYHSAYRSYIKMVGGKVVLRDPSDDIYDCWRTLHSTNVLTGSSARLTKDVIDHLTLQTLPTTSLELQSRYSINVDQFVITEDAYNYWQELKKNTEDIGNIFGPQPSQLSGNMHCISNPQESALGYFSAATIQHKRIFVDYAELPDVRHETGYEQCVIDTIKLSTFSTFNGGELLINGVSKGPGLYGYLASSQDCVDCRLYGGSITKPYFWQ